MDKFYSSGMMGTYIKLRNSAGAGNFVLESCNLLQIQKPWLVILFQLKDIQKVKWVVMACLWKTSPL